MGRRALVLGAGGHAAITWELGVLAGMAEAGVDICDADVIVGTSAGSLVAVQITRDLSETAPGTELVARRKFPLCHRRAGSIIMSDLAIVDGELNLQVR